MTRSVARMVPVAGALGSAFDRNGRGRTFGGSGPLAAGLHNNLTSAEYRQLGGPPLAPRGRYSRVITNLLTDHEKLREGVWQVTYWWDDVVDVRGNLWLCVANGTPGTGRQVLTR